jgi:predicted CXXCH cytochrome family protein
MNPLRCAIFIACLLAIATARVGAALPATARAQPAKPHEAIEQAGCLRDDCHASIRARAVIHGPVTSKACDACHELLDVQSHTFKLTREKAKLCTYCHEFDLSAMPVVHKPVKSGQCLGCHDPHGGTSKALLREASVRETCNRCHEDITHDKSFLHTPVAEGACDSCHPPHASRFPKLLDRAGPDLCLACHEGFDTSLSRAKFTHKAMESGCEKCHDPHGSKYAMSTTQPVTEQCAGCHEKIKTEAMNASYPHTPVLKDKACLTCHTPHGGNLAKLVSDLPETLCMSCHSKEQKAAGNRSIAAVAELMSPQSRHGGIKDGSCAGCHAAHGGNRELFLARNYSSLFYQRFSVANYELCLGCHDPKLITETRTTRLTAFRNGDRNLHALHVRDTRERGENCRVCHPTHAGTDTQLVRDVVSYGAWRMPMRFSRTADGGSCYPGCHPQYGYHRSKPVKNTLGKPTTSPASMPIARERPTRIIVNAMDVTGATITIPGGDRPTVIALVRADPSTQSDDVLNLLTITLKDRADWRMIVVRSGVAAGATTAAPAMPLRNCFTLADADGSIASELDVHGWPTTLVVTAAGVEIARLSGAPESLPIKLPAYLDLADGKITSATTQVAVQTIVGDEAEKKGAHEIRRVEMLITSGKPNEALKLLLKLPDGAMPAWQYNLLGARALAALNRWPEAKSAAEAALAEHANLPQAHFLLGQVYEHAGDWPRAAAEYRAAIDH